MHFLCSPLGSAGDVHPFLGLALELRRRGHEVTFLANEYFKDLVEALGLEYVELGTRQEFLDATSNPDLWDPIRAFKHIFTSLIELAVRQQYEIFARYNRPGQSVGLINCFGLGALVAQDKLEIPVATVHLQPGVIWSNVRPPVLAGMFGPVWLRNLQCRVGERFFIDAAICPGLNAFRAELGLPPVKRMLTSWNSKRGVVCLFPDWYAAPAPDWPANLMQTDFPLWDMEGAEQLPPVVEEFLAQGTAPLVFTPGSANRFGRKFLEASVEACRMLGRRGILLTRFAEQVPSPLPKEVAHFDYVPFTHLLSRSAGVAHHGGIGSTAQGLAAGIPQLLMPLAHDQFDNAAHVRRLGVGDWLKPARYAAQAVAERFDALLSSPQVQHSCRAIAQKLSARDGCQRTAEVLEQWAERNLAATVATAGQR